MNIKFLRFLAGGDGDLYKVEGIFYFMFFVFNLIGLSFNYSRYIEAIPFVLPFLFASIFLLIYKDKKFVDFIFDFLLFCAFVLISKEGEFSGIAFLFLLFARLSERIDFLILLSINFLLLCCSAILYKWNIPQTFLSLLLLCFMSIKYYYIIHVPKKELKERIKILESKLFRLGPAKDLEPKDILARYPFLNERRIHDLRFLAVGKSAAELAYNNGITYSAQSKEVKKIMVGFEKITGSKIMSVGQLIKIGIEAGVIQVRFINL